LRITMMVMAVVMAAMAVIVATVGGMIVGM
jgi:hypothetical protein